MKPVPRIESDIIVTVLGKVPDPPVDLRRIAIDIGVRDVRTTDEPNGFTHFDNSGPVIYLGRAYTSERTRFVFAHELAHVMLSRAEVQDLICERGAMRLALDEERLANRVAATLLFPDRWVRALQSSDMTLSNLRDAAHKARVSLGMLIIRLAAAGADVAMLRWQRGERSWYVVDRPGTPRSLHRSIDLSEASAELLDTLGHAAMRIVLEGSIDGKPFRMRGEVRRRDRYAAQLIHPSTDIWIGCRQSSTR